MRTMSMQENVLGEALAFARRVTSAQIDTAVLLNLGCTHALPSGPRQCLSP